MPREQVGRGVRVPRAQGERAVRVPQGRKPVQALGVWASLAVRMVQEEVSGVWSARQGSTGSRATRESKVWKAMDEEKLVRRVRLAQPAG